VDSKQVYRIGFWSGLVLVVLGLAYLGIILVMMISGSGFPPIDPFLTAVNILVLITAVWMVFFWVVLSQAITGKRILFVRISLAFMVIFATLTSINRYVALTVVNQSLAAGNTDGLQWFLPYTWPSIMLAIEYLAWGFFLGLACLSLAFVFTQGRLEHAIFWTLIITGLLSLIALVGQVSGSNSSSFSPFTMAGVLGWGQGLTLAAGLITIWCRKNGRITDSFQ
jgi:hypothetical protein